MNARHIRLLEHAVVEHGARRVDLCHLRSREVTRRGLDVTHVASEWHSKT